MTPSLQGNFLFGMCRGSDGLRVTATGPSKTLACSMSLSPFSDDVPQLTKLVTCKSKGGVEVSSDFLSSRGSGSCTEVSR
jgi:hypothetical protein